MCVSVFVYVCTCVCVCVFACACLSSLHIPKIQVMLHRYVLKTHNSSSTRVIPVA